MSTSSSVRRRLGAPLGLALALGAPWATAQPQDASGCRPVVAAPQGPARAGQATWPPGQRLALIEKRSVPCVHQDTGRAATCRVGTGVRWGLGQDGRRYAAVGQPIARDGRPGGDHVIAARVVDGTVPCADAPTARGTAGVPIGQELVGTCIVETINATHNRTGQPLRNVATIPVCTRTHPHPDGATLHSTDRANGVYCYIGAGAGLNDENGRERDANGAYLPGCHVLWHNGLEVFAAKRPAVRGYPKRVDPQSELAWRPHVRGVKIAN